jgi:hypothetical protein
MGIIFKYQGDPTTSVHTRVVHTLASHAFLFERYDQDADSFSSRASSTYGSSAVIGPNTISNPLLGSIDDVVISFSPRRGGNICDIRSGCMKSLAYGISN